MTPLRAAIRRRFTAGRIAFAAALIIGALGAQALIQNAGSAGAPPDNAARLVPANALVYLHATIDRDSDQWRNGTHVAARVPQLAPLRNRLLQSVTPHGGRIDLEREVYPWLGDEAAIALLQDKGHTARSLIVLEVSDEELARAFLSRAVGKPGRDTYRGTVIHKYGRLATAFLGHFLAIGQLENVRAAIDADHARIGSLESSPTFRTTRAALPNENRLLYGYASREGVAGLLRPRPGLVGRLSALVSTPRLAGAAAALDAEPKGARVSFASVLTSRTGGRNATEADVFEPRLLTAVPRDAVAYVGMRGADRLFSRISTLADSSALRLGPALSRLRSELSGRRSPLIRRALRPFLSKEAALFVMRPRGVPILTLLVDRVRSDEAARLLERLQPLFARVLERPSAGQVATFRPLTIAGVNAVSLRISPTVELTFSAFGGRAVLTTAPQGVALVKSARSSILDNPLFDQQLHDHTGPVSSVLFLDLEQLLALGEQAGLRETRVYRQLRTDLSQVSAVSAVTSSSETAGKAAGKAAGNTIRKAAIFIEVP